MDPYKVTAKGGRQGHKVKKDESILNQRKPWPEIPMSPSNTEDARKSRFSATKFTPL